MRWLIGLVVMTLISTGCGRGKSSASGPREVPSLAEEAAAPVSPDAGQASTPAERSLVLRIAAFTSVETSEDGAFSIITGRTISGKDFRIRATWEMIERGPDHIESWISHRKPDHGPYVLAGTATGTAPIVLKVDTCTPRGARFKAPAEWEY